MDGLVDMINDGPRDDMAIRVVVRKRPLTHAERGRGVCVFLFRAWLFVGRVY